jgi:hypothetical protein
VSLMVALERHEGRSGCRRAVLNRGWGHVRVMAIIGSVH